MAPIDAPHSGLPTAFRNFKNGSVKRKLRPGETVARGLLLKGLSSKSDPENNVIKITYGTETFVFIQRFHNVDTTMHRKSACYLCK